MDNEDLFNLSIFHSILCCDVLCCLTRPDTQFLEAICSFPMVFYMVGSIDKYVTHNITL